RSIDGNSVLRTSQQNSGLLEELTERGHIEGESLRRNALQAEALCGLLRAKIATLREFGSFIRWIHTPTRKHVRPRHKPQSTGPSLQENLRPSRGVSHEQDGRRRTRLRRD